MFEGSRKASPAPWGLLVAGVLTLGASAVAYRMRPPPPPPPAPYVVPFSWDATGLKLHRSAAVVRCFDERARAPEEDPEEVVAIVFGAVTPDGAWDAHAVSVQAGAHTDLERCLTKALVRVDVLERGATESVGWRVKLATWDRHPM